MASNKILTKLSDPCAVTRAGGTEIIEFKNVKVHEKIKTRVVKSVSYMFEVALQQSYSDSNEVLRSLMFNIVEHAQTKSSMPAVVVPLTKFPWPVPYNRNG